MRHRRLSQIDMSLDAAFIMFVILYLISKVPLHLIVLELRKND